MKDIDISTDAFWSITLATTEVFKRECFGFLVGYEATDRWLVQRAIPHQAARRHFSWVEPQLMPRRRIENAIRSLALGEKTIGWFHSHPEWGDNYASPTLSEDDIKYAKEGDVVLVVAVHGRKKAVRWGQNRNGSISGTMGDYHLTLAAFTKTGLEKVNSLRVHCAYAHGFTPE